MAIAINTLRLLIFCLIHEDDDIFAQKAVYDFK